MTPGYKTTEFWVTILTVLGGVALVLLGHNELGAVMLGGGGAQGVNYGRGRVELKGKMTNG